MPVSPDSQHNDTSRWQQRSVQQVAELYPPSIQLPDGEEQPYGSTAYMQLHDTEQHAELLREFIRPPPNRTVFDGASPPSYRSNSICSLPSHKTVSKDSSGKPLVMRCYSMSQATRSMASATANSQLRPVVAPREPPPPYPDPPPEYSEVVGISGTQGWQPPSS